MEGLAGHHLEQIAGAKRFLASRTTSAYSPARDPVPHGRAADAARVASVALGSPAVLAAPMRNS